MSAPGKLVRSSRWKSGPSKDAPDESASDTGLDPKYSDGHEVGPGELRPPVR
jgi:hypothetical protein